MLTYLGREGAADPPTWTGDFDPPVVISIALIAQGPKTSCIIKLYPSPPLAKYLRSLRKSPSFSPHGPSAYSVD